MLGSKNILSNIFKVVFLLIQIFIVFSGIVFLLINWICYVKAPILFKYAHNKNVLPILFTILCVVSGILGFNPIINQGRFRIFVFLFFLTALLNTEIFLIFYINKMTGHIKEWLNGLWVKSDNLLRNTIQEKFSCCGFETVNDRNGIFCPSGTPCLSRLRGFVNSIINFTLKYLLGMFILDSIGLIILSYVKFSK